MKTINHEVMDLLKKYGPNLKQALEIHEKLEYLYALAPLRENLLEWFEFKADASLLQIGADFGALTGLYSKRVTRVTVLEEDGEAMEVVRLRHGDKKNIQYHSGTLEEEKPESYDYVVIAGSLRAPCQEQLETAKRRLKPGGSLIVAACNRFGLKYFAGAKADPCSTTRNELAKFLPGGKFYYPMPDYKLASVIYSDRYLPKKGDLTDTLAVYDYPRYLYLDVGASYDAVCEDGQFTNFANSFLVIWEKGE